MQWKQSLAQGPQAIPALRIIYKYPSVPVTSSAQRESSGINLNFKDEIARQEEQYF